VEARDREAAEAAACAAFQLSDERRKAAAVLRLLGARSSKNSKANRIARSDGKISETSVHSRLAAAERLYGLKSTGG
jgi:hypothetical protein